MNKIKIIFRNLFGWKTSDLIEHLIATKRYDLHSRYSSKHYMCNVIHDYLGIDDSPHCMKIVKRIRHFTLHNYLYDLLTREPTKEEMLAFWHSYIQELRVNGE